MAAFADFAACEVRAVAKVADGTWIAAHACRQKDGTLAVRVQRKMSTSSAATQQYGAWTELTSDSST